MHRTSYPRTLYLPNSLPAPNVSKTPLVAAALFSALGGTWSWWPRLHVTSWRNKGVALWRNDKAATITGNNYPTRCSYITRPSLRVSNGIPYAVFPSHCYRQHCREWDGTRAVNAASLIYTCSSDWLFWRGTRNGAVWCIIPTDLNDSHQIAMCRMH
jgi:hypothetical protein